MCCTSTTYYSTRLARIHNITTARLCVCAIYYTHMFTIHRFEKNPILSPLKTHSWESKATFNGAPIQIDSKTTALLYRAMSEADPYKTPHFSLSVIGVAFSKNGGDFEQRQPLVIPSEDFDRYGCEDPRVSKIDDTYYIFYTALGGYPYGPENIRTAVALSKDLKTIYAKHLITPFNAKAMALFPKKIGDKYAAFITIDTDPGPSKLCYRTFATLEELWDHKKWEKWYHEKEKHELQLRRKERDHVELGAVPVLTKKGWLLIYSHIQNYWTDHPLFGVEALLLDTANPKKLIGRTKGPFLTPEWYYEKIGQVANIVFPTGALIKKNTLEVYYGAADNFCAKALLPLPQLLAALTEKSAVIRYKKNPILTAREGFDWEAGGVCNPATIDIDGTVHILYRAATTNNVSTFGYACSKDGLSIDERLDMPVYVPRADFESHGCEDPRITRIGNTLYMMYTGFNGSVPRIVATSISVKDFVARKWDKWAPPAVLTPDSIPDKDATVLPEKFAQGYLIIHRAGNGICGDYFPTLDFTKEQITKCIDITDPRNGMWDTVRIGLSCPLIKTKKGWVMLYHGISWSGKYRVGALLLDLKDPTIVLARTAAPFFEPETEYESQGVVSHVVFPCGVIERKGLLYIYYGAADKYIGVATLPLKKVLEYLVVAE